MNLGQVPPLVLAGLFGDGGALERLGPQSATDLLLRFFEKGLMKLDTQGFELIFLFVVVFAVIKYRERGTQDPPETS